jgi:hypothetical protein
MAENGVDKELREAIGENIVAIARRRAILEDLQKHGAAAFTVAPQPAAQERAGLYL